MLKIIVSVLLTSALLVGGAFGVYKHQELMVLTKEEQTSITMYVALLGMMCAQPPAVPNKGI